jgi:probable HAF family extracellular repeat protein
MRTSKIHLNPALFRAAMAPAIAIVTLAGLLLMASHFTPIAALAAISDSESLSGNFSSSQPGDAPIPALSAGVTITNLGTLDPKAINDLGQIVGKSTASGDNHAYLWYNGSLTDLGGDGIHVRDINLSGQVVGVNINGTSQRAFLWQNDKITYLGTLGGPRSWANGINNLHQVAGESEDASQMCHAFLWQNDKMTDLGTLNTPCGFGAGDVKAINELGQVVGSSVVYPMGWTHASLWQNGTKRDLGALPRGAESYANDINEHGQVVGYSNISFDNPSYVYNHAFLWEKGWMTDLGTLGGDNSYANAINDRGQVVGNSQILPWGSQQHAFLWYKSKMFDLNDLVASTGWTLYDVFDINNAGQVVGKMMLNDYSHVQNVLLMLPPELSVEEVKPVQVLENQDLVEGKATAVKAVIRNSGGRSGEKVAVKLTYGASTYERFYVADEANLDKNHALVSDNSRYPLTFATDTITKTIYFFSDGLAPLGKTFQVSVMVDPQNEFAEFDETDNSATSSVVNVYDTRWPSVDSNGILPPDLNIYYLRTDGLSRHALDTFYAASNKLVVSVFPVAERRFLPGKSLLTVDTKKARGSDGKLDWLELGKWISDTLKTSRLADPYASRFVAAVPSGWFQTTIKDSGGVSLTTAVGVAYPNTPELVLTEARTGAKPNGSNLVAHEIGHSYGLGFPCEEYDGNCDHVQDRNGIIVTRGLWVKERIPIQVPKARDIFCFMGAGPGLEYWIDAADYSKLFIDHRITNAFGANEPRTAAGVILVGANFDMNGTVTLDPWYTLPEANLTELAPGPYIFEYQDAHGNVLYQRSFDISFSLEGGNTLPRVALVATIPGIPDTAKIVVKQYDTPLAEKVISANTPAVTLISPNGGEQLSGTGTIHWSGSDADGDALSYTVLISPDNGATWEPIAGDLTGTSTTWDVSQLPAGESYLVKVIATDGFNTGYDLSDTPFSIKAPIYLPLIPGRN